MARRSGHQCLYGHALDGPNGTVARSSGKLECRECNRLRTARWRARKNRGEVKPRNAPDPTRFDADYDDPDEEQLQILAELFRDGEERPID